MNATIQRGPACQRCGHPDIYHAQGKACFKITRRDEDGEPVVACECPEYVTDLFIEVS